MEGGIEGVAVGAILSDYQRVRVENICSRLGLVNFAPLWQKDQSQYLEDLEDVGIDSVIVKERFHTVYYMSEYIPVSHDLISFYLPREVCGVILEPPRE